MTVAPSEFDTFCRFAFAFLEERGIRTLVVGGLAVIVVGEPRITADADAVVFVSPSEAQSLIHQATEAGSTLPTSSRLCRRSVNSRRTPRCGIAYRKSSLVPDAIQTECCGRPDLYPPFERKWNCPSFFAAD